MAEDDSHKLAKSRDVKNLTEQVKRIADELSVDHPVTPVYDSTKGEYTPDSIQKWIAAGCDGKTYGVTGTLGKETAMEKTYANAEMGDVVLSTLAKPGNDPYMGVGPFRWYRCNGYYDAQHMPHVTAMKIFDDRYADDGSNGDVWNLIVPIYFRETTEEKYEMDIRDTPLEGFEPWDALGNTYGTDVQNPFVLIAPWNMSLNENGVPVTVKGRKVQNRTVSHDSLVGLCAKKQANSQTAGTAQTIYSGYTSCDLWYLQMMCLMKYATKDFQTIMQGCTGYTTQCSPTVAETGVKRIIIKTTDANQLLVGSAMQFGTHTTTSTDRSDSKTYDIFDGAEITKIEAYDDSNSAVYFDIDKTFDTATTYLLSTIGWNPGSCDDLYSDGSLYNPQSAKEPAYVQGIEFMTGFYEVISDVMFNNSGSGWDVYVTPDMTDDKSGALAASAEKVYTLPATDTDTVVYGLYPKTLNGYMIQQGTGGSQTTGMGDQLYKNEDATIGLRECLVFCSLMDWRNAGPFYVNAGTRSGSTWWNFVSRLSGTRRAKRATS